MVSAREQYESATDELMDALGIEFDPRNKEKSEAGDPVEEGPFGGMFNDGDDRTMQDVEDVPMDDYPEAARENAALGGDSGNLDKRCLGGVSDRDLQHAPEWDRPLMEMHRGVTDPDAAQDRALVSFAASETPEFVLERIKDAIRGGALFSEFDDVDSDRLMEFREMFADAVGTDDFTLDTITEEVMEFADMDRDTAERIARTESSAALNSAREDGYEERGEGDELFYWTGAEPGDDRQTAACRRLIERTNPFHGGEPVPLEELRSLLTWAAEQDPDMDTSMVREDNWLIHIGERSTFAKAPPNYEQL